MKMSKFTKKIIGFIIRTLKNYYDDGLSYSNIKLKKRLKKKSINFQRYKLYRKKWLLDTNINTVLDIGANIGEFTIIFHEHFPKAKIYAFEPLPDCFSRLRKRTKDVDNIKVFNLGLGSKDGVLKINKSSWHPASSFRKMGELHKKNYPHSSDSIDIDVRINKLDDVLNENDLSNDIFIKIDVQGFEDEVIKGGINTFRKAKVIVIESSFQQLYENEPMFSGIYALLQPLGFEFRGSLKQSINKNDDSFLQGDCIFFKPY